MKKICFSNVRINLLLILLFFKISLYTQINSNIIVNDSIIIKYKIKKVSLNIVSDTFLTKPNSSKIVIYNSINQIIFKSYTNYSYYKTESYFKYSKFRNSIIEKKKNYDWNNRIYNGDTVIKKHKYKYNLKTGKKKKLFLNKIDKFKQKIIKDSLNRIVKTIDTIKCGHYITLFSYNNVDNIIEKTRYRTRHDDKPYSIIVDSFFYNKSNQLILKKKNNFSCLNCNSTKEKPICEYIDSLFYNNQNQLVLNKTYLYNNIKDTIKNTSIEIREYKYYENGLIKEIKSHSIHFWTETYISKPIYHLYEYEFHYQ